MTVGTSHDTAAFAAGALRRWWPPPGPRHLRSVQTYISRILTKLDARSRVEIVREAVRQGVPL